MGFQYADKPDASPEVNQSFDGARPFSAKSSGDRKAGSRLGKERHPKIQDQAHEESRSFFSLVEYGFGCETGHEDERHS